MSLSRSVHVGPYLECRVETIETTETVWTCPIPGCPGPGYVMYRPDPHVKWCPQCGTPIGPVERIAVRPRVNHSEARMEIREALHDVDEVSDDFVYWLPNVKRDAPRAFSVDDDIVIDLSHDLPDNNEWIWFNRAFAPEIAKLRELYGEGNVGTRWGVVAYTS